jgi:hypothetical protein
MNGHCQCPSHVRKVPILLQKSFLGDERNFLGPLMPFARGDMRDHIVSHKNDHGASQGLYAVLQWWIRLKISFCRFSASFDFRLLQQYPLNSGHSCIGSSRPKGAQKAMSLLCRPPRQWVALCKPARRNEGGVRTVSHDLGQ